MYMKYYATEVNEPGDKAPIVIILYTDKDNVSAQYALGSLSNNIFAATYTYVISEKEKLIAQVETVLEQWKIKDVQLQGQTSMAIYENRQVKALKIIV